MKPAIYRPHNYPGRLIQFEGPDGGGKNTHIELLVERLQQEAPHIPVIATEVPGGTPEMNAGLRYFLYGNLSKEERAQFLIRNHEAVLREVVIPALERGELVIMSRSPWSYIVYQGFVEGKSFHETYPQVKKCIELAPPDVMIQLSIPPLISWLRANRRARDNGHETDHFESGKLDKYRQVDRGYKETRESFRQQTPSTQFYDVYDLNGSSSELATHEKVWTAISRSELLKQWTGKVEGGVSKELYSATIGRER